MIGTFVYTKTWFGIHFTSLSGVLESLNISKTLLTKRAMYGVSTVTRPDSPLHCGEDPLSNWQTVLDKDQIRKILDIVEKFEIGLYSDNIYPNKGWLAHNQFLHAKSKAITKINIPVFA